MKQQKTAAILYGFSEGPWHGKRFRKELVKQGYEIIQHAQTADLIIAHSAGCFYIDNLSLRDEQRVVYIGPPYWPGKPGLYRGTKKVGHDLILLLRPDYFTFSLKKLFYNAWYIFVQPRRNKYMLGRLANYDLAASLEKNPGLVIRNNKDPWLISGLEYLPRKSKRTDVLHLEGDHDDCWRNPKKYINAILES